MIWKRLLRPSILALLIWSTWAAMLLWLYARHQAGVLHPYFLPVTLLMTVLAVAGLVLLVVGLRRMIRGPRRLRAAACVLLGIFPLWVSSAYGMYILWRVDHRDIGIRAAGLDAFGAVGGAALADLEARIRFPHRFEGRHVVMWSDRADGAERQVAAADRHIERLAGLLGRDCRAKVHWVRGSLLGQSRRYWQGIALGTRHVESGGGLRRLDRHELAHFVIEHLCGRDNDPPTVLIEGWAEWVEAHSDDAPDLAALLWQRKQEGAVFSLQEFVSDEWYDRNLSPVYQQGALLVDYLLRTYGGERFLELYSTCRRETFAEDCRRVLGVSPAELDRAFWEDLERQVTAETFQRRHHPLLSVELADGVDEDQWRHVATEHWKAYQRARALFRQVRFAVESRREYRKGYGHPRTLVTHDRFARDGLRVCSISRIRDSDDGPDSKLEVIVADPRLSFRLTRRESDSAWRPERIGRSGVTRYDMLDAPNRAKLALFLSYCYITRRTHYGLVNENALLTDLKPVEAGGRTLWRLEWGARGQDLAEDDSLPSGEWWDCSALLAPQQNWTIQEMTTRRILNGETLSTSRTTREYAPPHEGVSLLRALKETGEGEKEWSWTLTASDYEFAPTPPGEFTPQAFGLSPADIPDADPTPRPVQLTAAGLLVSLIGGLLLFGVSSWAARRTGRADLGRSHGS